MFKQESIEGHPDLKIHIYEVTEDLSQLNNWFESCMEDIEWTEGTIKIFGKERKIPRLQAWYADQNINYSYSGKKLVRNNSRLSGHLVLYPPLKEISPDTLKKLKDRNNYSDPRVVKDDFKRVAIVSKLTTASSASASDINSILKAWKALRSLELPHLTDFANVDYKLCENLRKVTLCSNFRFPKSLLPYWLSVYKISFDPKESRWFTLKNASHLIVILDYFKDFDFESVDHDLACVEKMGNLETLQLEISWNWGDAFHGSPLGVDETRLILPLLKKLSQFCSKIHSLVLNLRNFPGGM